MTKRIAKIITKILTVIFTILSVVIILFALYNFVSVKLLKCDYSNIFGYTFFEVISGSMSPTIEKGDLIFVDVGANYDEDDIVTFKSDGVFITHRVISIDESVVVTRGDANNSLDNPVNKENIIGKVVNVVPSFGVWVNIITTPKVAIAIIITLILLTLSFSFFNKEEKLDDNDVQEEKKGKEMKKDKDKKNHRLFIEIVILVVLLAILSFLIPFTLSRFKTEAKSDAEIDIAFYLVNDEYQYKDIKLEEVVPSNSYYTYSFTVSNNDGTNRTETTLKYDLEIVTTTNLPLEYDLYLNNTYDNVGATSIVSSDVVSQDEDGTYFRTIKAVTRTFGFDVNQTDTYQLVVKFPSQYRDYKYQDISENIEIRIMSSQVLESDN